MSSVRSVVVVGRSHICTGDGLGIGTTHTPSVGATATRCDGACGALSIRSSNVLYTLAVCTASACIVGMSSGSAGVGAAASEESGPRTADEPCISMNDTRGGPVVRACTPDTLSTSVGGVLVNTRAASAADGVRTACLPNTSAMGGCGIGMVDTWSIMTAGASRSCVGGALRASISSASSVRVLGEAIV